MQLARDGSHWVELVAGDCSLAGQNENTIYLTTTIQTNNAKKTMMIGRDSLLQYYSFPLDIFGDNNLHSDSINFAEVDGK